MDQQERLAKFKHAVFQEIADEVEALGKEAREQSAERLQRESEELKRRAEADTQQQIQELQKEFRKETAKCSLEAKRSVLQRRNELLEELYASVEARLRSFQASEEYPPYLLARVKAFAIAHPIPDAEILVGEQDLPLAESIRKAYGLSCTVAAEPSLELGGFLVRGGAALYDETVSQRLAEEKHRILAMM